MFQNNTSNPLYFRKLRFWPPNADVASHFSDSAATSVLCFVIYNYLKKKEKKKKENEVT
jgi:hypothetical protein